MNTKASRCVRSRAGGDPGKIKGAEDKKEDAPPAGDLASLIALIKLTLGDEVKDARISDRLTESAVCLVADEGDLDIHLERFLKQHNQIRTPSKRILEVNPGHDLIVKMAARAGAKGATDALKDAVWLLYDQARLMDGETLSDPAGFGRRINAVLKTAVG